LTLLLREIHLGEPLVVVRLAQRQHRVSHGGNCDRGPARAI
jgi:hypothetical protein